MILRGALDIAETDFLFLWLGQMGGRVINLPSASHALTATDHWFPARATR